jgi:hypothetical protein
MAFIAYSAKNAKVRIGATVVVAKQWDVEPQVDELDVTNFEGGGYHEVIGGIKKLTVNIQLDDNGLENIYDVIKPGDDAALVKLYLNDTAGPFWYIPYLFISRMPQRADVKAAMSDTIQGTGNGSWSYPTGAAVS